MPLRTLKLLKGLRLVGKGAQGKASCHLMWDTVNSVPLPGDLDSGPRSALCCAMKPRGWSEGTSGPPGALTAVSLVLDLSGFLSPWSQATL